MALVFDCAAVFYAEGFSDRVEGRGRQSKPDLFSPVCRTSWLEGWDAADAELTQKEPAPQTREQELRC